MDDKSPGAGERLDRCVHLFQARRERNRAQTGTGVPAAGLAPSRDFLALGGLGGRLGFALRLGASSGSSVICLPSTFRSICSCMRSRTLSLYFFGSNSSVAP